MRTYLFLCDIIVFGFLLTGSCILQVRLHVTRLTYFLFLYQFMLHYKLRQVCRIKNKLASHKSRNLEMICFEKGLCFGFKRFSNSGQLKNSCLVTALFWLLKSKLQYSCTVHADCIRHYVFKAVLLWQILIF